MEHKFKITTSAYQEIVKKIGSQEPEKGGILMGKNGVVTDFIFDKAAATTRSTYTLNVAYLNPMIKELKQQGKELLGVIHSHPNGYSNLSEPDREYFSSQFKNFPNLEYMYTPIVFSAKQDEFEIFPYVFHKNGNIEIAELEIVPNDYGQYVSKQPQKPKKPVKPDAKTVKDRKRILVDIRQKIEIPNQKEHIQSTQLLHLAMTVSGLYILLLGIGIGISLMVLLYFMNNLAVVSTLLTQFI
jgi:proteasome lid subunit RPN8/RPN11